MFVMHQASNVYLIVRACVFMYVEAPIPPDGICTPTLILVK